MVFQVQNRKSEHHHQIQRIQSTVAIIISSLTQFQFAGSNLLKKAISSVIKKN